MAFSKQKYDPYILIEIKDSFEDETYSFKFPKNLPPLAEEEIYKQIGKASEQRDEEYTEAVVKLVGNMLLEAPTNFEDFPQDDRPLSERFIEYFNDPEFSRLGRLAKNVWFQYINAALPAAYLRRTKDPHREAAGA